MIKVLNYTFFSLLLIFTFGGCKRTQKDGILGPDLKVASNAFVIIDSFKVFGIDRSIDFTSPKVDLSRAETIYFTKQLPSPGGTTVDSIIRIKPRSTYFKAKFNEEVHWRIEIAPSNSGTASPYKLISGTSSYIDSVPGWTWDGSSDNQYYFRPGKIDFRFSILGSKDTSIITKTLVNAMVLDSTSGILLNDFEGDINIVPYGDNKDKIANPLPSIISGLPLTPQGSRSLLVSGTDHNGDYFVGGSVFQFKKGMLKGHNASDIYINMYIYGFPQGSGFTPNATKIGIGVSQDNVNNSGDFDAGFEDTFDQQISVDWVGWKLISVKYSNLKRSTAMNDGGSGPNKIQPETAVSVGCNLLSSPNGSTVGAALDYIIITFGKPLDK